ncbi:MAG TPA: TonB-dependent receptor, partial [Bacteroidia bacterium]|nr:TonB-dependent receptor [Bacteroidia bacterium]
SPDMYIAAIRMNWELTEKTRFQISASAILGQRNSVQFIGSPLVADTLGPRIVDRDYYNSYSAEAKLMHEYRLFKRQHTVLAGIRWINNTTLRSQQGGGTTAGDYDLSLISPYKIDINFHTDGYAGFIENSFSIAKKLTATAGIRYEVNSTSMRGKFFNTRAEDIPVGLNRNILLGGVGIQYSVSPHMQVYGNFSQAYRPVLYSDILPASPLDRVNPGLKDAYGSNSEAGIRGSIENLLFYDITLFAMVYNNRAGQVIQEENSNVYFYKTNIGNTLATGIEYYLELFVSRYFKKLASQGLNMSVYTSGMYNNASYTSGIVAKGAENINVTNNRLENAPEFINRAGINFYYRGFSTAVQASHVSSMYTDALNTQSTPTGVNGIVPAYTVFDFNMAYAITEKVNIRASINNFTDKMYYTRRATGYPGPGILPSDGRSFVITLSAGVD